MSLLDSLTVDHTRMEAPAVRVIKTVNILYGDAITVLDLCFCVPNREAMPERRIHTLERLPAGFMCNHPSDNGVKIIDISPMGCRIGFYMSLIDTPGERRVTDAWKAAMEDVLKVQGQNQIPELNIYQYGTYRMYSLQETQDTARSTLERDVRINSNEELVLPKEKSQELYTQPIQAEEIGLVETPLSLRYPSVVRYSMLCASSSRGTSSFEAIHIMTALGIVYSRLALCCFHCAHGTSR